MTVRQAKLLSYVQTYWQVMIGVIVVVVAFATMRTAIEANAKETAEWRQVQLRQAGRMEEQRRQIDARIDGQRSEVETLKQSFARVDERMKGFDDKLDGQTRTIERILDLVQKK